MVGQKRVIGLGSALECDQAVVFWPAPCLRLRHSRASRVEQACLPAVARSPSIIQQIENDDGSAYDLHLLRRRKRPCPCLVGAKLLLGDLKLAAVSAREPHRIEIVVNESTEAAHSMV